MTFGIGSAYDIWVDDTFVMVGGYLTDYEGDGTEGYSDKLIKYLPENGGKFMELPGKMNLPRKGSTAILVDKSIFPSCTCTCLPTCTCTCCIVSILAVSIDATRRGCKVGSPLGAKCV